MGYRFAPMFYVMDENGKQIEALDFTTYGPAVKRARELSRTMKIKTMVGVCVPSTVYVNGRAKN